MAVLVSITEAARRLSTDEGRPLDRSTLSRYVNRYVAALAPQGRGRQVLVDYDLLRRHRAENLNISAPSPPAEATAAPAVQGPSARDSRARKEEADAQLRELELERQLGSVCPVDEVQRAAAAAVALMQAASERAVRDHAEIIARALGVDARVIRPHLKRFGSELSRAFAEACRREAARFADGDEVSLAPAPADAAELERA